MVTNLGHDFLPLFDERSLSAVAFVFRKNELSGVAPGPQFVDGFSNRDFALRFVGQFLDFFGLFQHGWHRVGQVSELQIVNRHFLSQTQELKQFAPVLFFKRFSCAHFKQRPSLFIVFNGLHQKLDYDRFGQHFDLLCLRQEKLLKCEVPLFAEC